VTPITRNDMHISSRHSQAGRDAPRQQAALVCGSVGHSEHVFEKFADSFLVNITSILQGGPRKRPIGALRVLVNEDVNMPCTISGNPLSVGKNF